MTTTSKTTTSKTMTMTMRRATTTRTTRTAATTKRTGRNELVAELAEKEARLTAVLSTFDSLLVAYSGGVDSAYLACAASRVLPGRVLCVTADSPSYPRHHREMAEDVA